mmetsp:Transcript_12191/g.26883  ORF Transcript_12191/g.26883 Transcript_12191/m.26883 type:complete len:416 (+) Transcript_12191:1-1248(+)
MMRMIVETKPRVCKAPGLVSTIIRIMKPMNTDYSKLEKGEDSHLLDEALVKPLSDGDIMNGGMAKKARAFSWFRCLCKTLLVLLLVLLVTTVVVAFGSYIWVRHQVKRFTVDGKEKNLPEPPLPVAPIPDAKLEVIKDEAKLFWDQLRAGVVPTEDLVISEEDINGLIASSHYMRGHAIVHISEGKWTADLALPMDKLPGGKGRFFVGTTNVETQTDHDNTKEMTHIVKEVTPKYPVRGVDFPTLMKAKYVAYSADSKPVLEMDYGQFLNWVAPEDWISKRENLLSCDDHDGCHGKHHHHRHHHHKERAHHHDDHDEDCEEFMAALARIEHITVEDKKIIFTPVREVVPAAVNEDGVEEKVANVQEMVANGEEQSREASMVVVGEGGGVRRRHLSKEEPPKMHHVLIRRVLREIF